MSSTEALVPSEVPPSYGSVPYLGELDSLLQGNAPLSSSAPTEAQVPYIRDALPPYEDIEAMIRSSRQNDTENDERNLAQPVVIMQPCFFCPSKTNFYVGPKLTAEPESITCRSCKEYVLTKVEARVSMRTHMCAMLCCVMGGCCCLGWLPYCVKKCKTKYHYCPKCDFYVGVGIEPPFCR